VILTATIVRGTASRTKVFSLMVAQVPVIGRITWSERTPMPTGRNRFDVGVVGNRIFAIAGEGVSGLDLNTVEEYDPLTDTWRTKTPMPAPRSGASAGVVDGKIYVFGGGPGSVGTVEMYDPTTDRWTTQTSMLTPRAGSGAAVIAGKAYVIGGNAKNGIPAEAYDPATDSWMVMTPLPNGRVFLSVCTVYSKLLCYTCYSSPRFTRLTRWSVPRVVRR
jgi:N-acetylneuraminic acid mutarotase